MLETLRPTFLSPVWPLLKPSRRERPLLVLSPRLLFGFPDANVHFQIITPRYKPYARKRDEERLKNSGTLMKKQNHILCCRLSSPLLRASGFHWRRSAQYLFPNEPILRFPPIMQSID